MRLGENKNLKDISDGFSGGAAWRGYTLNHKLDPDLSSAIIRILTRQPGGGVNCEYIGTFIYVSVNGQTVVRRWGRGGKLGLL